MQSKSSNNGSSSASSSASSNTSSKRLRPFDTLAIVQDLGKAGVEQPMAMAIAKALQGTSDYILSQTVTREDFAEFKAEMNAKFAAFKAEMDLRFAEFRAEMDLKFADFKADIRSEMYRVVLVSVGITLTGTAMLLGICMAVLQRMLAGG